MQINKLSKEILAEGITLELVNSLSMEKDYSPIQLQAGDEPAHILKCSKGFWVMVEGKALKNEKNVMIVWGERECQIGRARYLVNFGDQVKKEKVDRLVADWKKQVREKLDDVFSTVHVRCTLGT